VGKTVLTVSDLDVTDAHETYKKQSYYS